MIYDISQELFSCHVFPGDMPPTCIVKNSIEKGDLYNLSDINLCVHNGTHIDAPLHFMENGEAIDKIPLGRLIGECLVIDAPSVISKEDVAVITEKGFSRILLKGVATITDEAAEAFSKKELTLLGVEEQSVGNAVVHRLLLGSNIIVLEGIVLNDVPEGKYTLFAAPLNLKGCEGSPCRAVLISE